VRKSVEIIWVIREEECVAWDTQLIVVLDKTVIDMTKLDSLIVTCNKNWVNSAPEEWRADSFLQDNSPIVVNTGFKQNTVIIIPGNKLYHFRDIH
jgi:hypothetical protein